MAETNHHHAHHVPPADPVEGDGINYRSIGWFIVILVVTVLASQLVVWGMFEFMEYRIASTEAPRAATAAPQSHPGIENGRVTGGAETGQPGLLVHEPTVLGEFNRAQDEALATYGWVDQAAGTVRLPIERAKDLVLERGLPTRPAAGTPAPATAPAAAATPSAR